MGPQRLGRAAHWSECRKVYEKRAHENVWRTRAGKWFCRSAQRRANEAPSAASCGRSLGAAARTVRSQSSPIARTEQHCFGLHCFALVCFGRRCSTPQGQLAASSGQWWTTAGGQLLVDNFWKTTAAAGQLRTVGGLLGDCWRPAEVR